MLDSIPEMNNFISRKIVQMFGNRGLFCAITDNDIPVLHGIRDGSKSFSGPEVVHLDLTNRCNLNCIACWCNSYLLKNKSMSTEQSCMTLPFEVITDFIDDLVEMGGIGQIKLGGGGEPTMHPRLDEVLAYIKSKDSNIEIDINTNFTRFDKKLIDLILESEVNLLTVSLWAATPATYVKTHPNQSEKTFNRIVDNLKKISGMRKNGLPRISIHNVIMNLNCHEIGAMLDLAMDVGADDVNFVLVDPVPGKTEQLLLSTKERLTLLGSFKQIKSKIDCFDNYADPQTGHIVRVVNFFELLRKLSKSDSDKGSYDNKTVNRIPCYIGWIFVRIMADGKVVPCCKGHRMAMGNLNKHRFKTIWHSSRYTRFRRNGLKLKRTDPYYSIMGNDLNKATGCYNCDNLMHNIVVHRKKLSQANILKWVKFELLQWIDR